jgi:Baseplate J-like protein
VSAGTYRAPTYPEVVRDLLTSLSGGVRGEAHPVPLAGPVEVLFQREPVRRVSFVQGEVALEQDRIPYRFTERDYVLLPSTAGEAAYAGLRFTGEGQLPAPGSTVVVNYYPVRLPPTPVNDLNVGSVVRTLLETVARELATQYQQLQLVYDSAYVQTASGTSLDHVAALVDVRRLRQGHPVGRVRMTRRAGSPGAVVVPMETGVTDGAGNRYLTTDPVTMLPSQSTIEVSVHGEAATTGTVAAGALTVLERAIAGVDRVTNDEATWRATEDETDDQLRLRARLAIHGSGRGTRDAIRSGLEALEFVSTVSLVELPEGVPGTLRVDVALRDDSPFNRDVVERTVTETRPAGIAVTVSYAERLDLTVDLALTLAGSFAPASVVEEVEDGGRRRLAAALGSLAPGATLRRARLLSAVLEDARIVDATVEVRVGGSPAAGDAVPLPAGLAVRLDPAADVTFRPAGFEAAPAVGPARQPVDVELSVTLLDATTSIAAVQSRVRAVLGPVLGAAAALSADTVQQTLAGETTFVAAAAATVVAVETAPGGFHELRPGDPPFTVPAGRTLQLRDVAVTDAAGVGGADPGAVP